MPLTKSQTTRLQFQLNDLIEWMNELNNEQLKKEIIPGKWSIWQNAVHLISYQPTFIKRMQRILEEDEPLLERYVAENDPLFYEYEKMNKEQLIADGVLKRNELYKFLISLSENELARKADHPAYGKLSIKNWTEFFLLHESHHFFTSFKLMQQLAQLK